MFAFIIIMSIPVILTIWNVITFVLYVIKKEEKKYARFIEVGSMLLGAIFTLLYIDLLEIKFEPWNKQLFNNQIHSMVLPDAFPTVMTFITIGFLSYILLRFIPINKQSPLISALAIAGIYMGIAICIVWCVQTISDGFLIIFPANCILIFIKAIYIVVNEKNKLIQTGQVAIKYKKLAQFLNKATNLPIIGLLLFLPLFGMVVAILFLFGQEPNSIIKAWTETADWTLSQRIAPQNAYQDEHYLCTVAAGGHRNVVKPIRPGIRHGHLVVVNRQLCVANAFEQVLEEKVPKMHQVIRKIYDNTGYPISKHIKSQTTADIIYVLMKPLEWFFVVVLYLVDVHPEDRIAVQYPHRTKPDSKDALYPFKISCDK